MSTKNEAISGKWHVDGNDRESATSNRGQHFGTTSQRPTASDATAQIGASIAHQMRLTTSNAAAIRATESFIGLTLDMHYMTDGNTVMPRRSGDVFSGLKSRNHEFVEDQEKGKAFRSSVH